MCSILHIYKSLVQYIDKLKCIKYVNSQKVQSVLVYTKKKRMDRSINHALNFKLHLITLLITVYFFDRNA